MNEAILPRSSPFKNMQDITPSNQSRGRQSAASLRDRHAAQRAAERVVVRRPVKTVNDVVTTSTQLNHKVMAKPTVNKQSIVKTQTATVKPVASVKPIEHLSTSAKAKAMEKALAQAKKSLKAERRKTRDLKRFGLVFIASVFVLVTGYVSIDTWMTNNRVKAEASSGATANSGTWSPDDEGQDEAKPSTESFKKYVVSPELPRAIYINKINVTARILPMSVNNKGAIQAPVNIYDAGWYNGSVKPGDIGAMFIDGHASGPTREGLFAYLDKLVDGDEIQIEKGDGTMLTYKVVHTEVIALADVDMKKMLLPYGNALRGLNLMTCTGNWVESEKTYDQRVLVYAEQV